MQDTNVKFTICLQIGLGMVTSKESRAVVLTLEIITIRCFAEIELDQYGIFTNTFDTIPWNTDRFTFGQA